MRLPVGSGKTKHEVRRVKALTDLGAYHSKGKMKERIVYVTMRDEIEDMNLGRFLKHFGPLGEGQWLPFIGRILFTVHGYEDDPRELFEIPEVRKFYAELNRIWPCWLYFSDPLHPDCLRSLVCCSLDDITIGAKKRSKNVQVRVPHESIKEFINQPLIIMSWLVEQGGIDDDRHVHQLTKVLEILAKG